jgi:hypothetical protein
MLLVPSEVEVPTVTVEAEAATGRVSAMTAVARIARMFIYSPLKNVKMLVC